MVKRENLNPKVPGSIPSNFTRIFVQIPSNAVIVTADVDAFVMTPRILLPIKKLPDKKIWVYRYAFTHTAGDNVIKLFTSVIYEFS